MTIIDRVKEQMGSNLTYTDPYLVEVTKNWQDFLQESAGITDADKYDETKWTRNYNYLISKLIIREAMTSVINKAISSAATSGKGGLKKLETGPSNAEWYEASESISNMVKTSSGASVTDIEGEICTMAIKLGIRFSFCNKIKGCYVFQVAKKKC